MNDISHNIRDYSSSVFSRICEAFLWPVPSCVSSRRTINPCPVSICADGLKKMISRFLKQRAILKKSMDELLKLDIKNVDIQLKDSEHEMSVPARQALKDVRNSGNQRQCYIGIRSFFLQTIAYIQKPLELNNPSHCSTNMSSPWREN